MNPDATTPSPALLEAQARLLERRAQVQAQRQALGLPTGRYPPTADPHQPSSSHPPTDHQATEGCPTEGCPSFLPSHLGWGSAPLTAVLRAAQQRRQKAADQEAARSLDWLPAPPATATPPPARPAPVNRPATVKHYPDLGLAALQTAQVPPFRLWLACRYLDQPGRGWLELETVYDTFTTAGAPLRLCSRRRLRQVLAAGEGYFWTRDEHNRLWLYGTARVALILGVARLSGHPVDLPLAVFPRIGDFKAHLYAAWHSGRHGQAQPVSRDTQEKVTGIPARTQRHYCRVAGIQRTPNLAVGQYYSQRAIQEAAWRRGNAVFEFIDTQGVQGPPNRRYVAWQLPSSHSAIHGRSPKGRQRKINRAIDLVIKGVRGNGARFEKLFHPNGAAAGKAYSRRPSSDAYWPGRAIPVQQQKEVQFWHVILRQ